MRVPTSLVVCLLPLVAAAAPPEVKLPAEVKGDVGAFVAVRATVTEAKSVKFVALDAGLNLFPADLLADKTATVVTSAKAGKYRLLCYSGNADGPSEPAYTVVVIGEPVKPEPPLPPPDKPADPKPPVPAEVFYFAVVRPDQNTAEFERLMGLPAWAELRAKGHVVNDIPVSQLPSGLARPTDLPTVMVLKKAGDKWQDTMQNRPMPTTDEQIRGLLK